MTQGVWVIFQASWLFLTLLAKLPIKGGFDLLRIGLVINQCKIRKILGN